MSETKKQQSFPVKSLGFLVCADIFMCVAIVLRITYGELGLKYQLRGAALGIGAVMLPFLLGFAAKGVARLRGTLDGTVLHHKVLKVTCAVVGIMALGLGAAGFSELEITESSERAKSVIVEDKIIAELRQRAEHGDAEAQYDLGHGLILGKRETIELNGAKYRVVSISKLGCEPTGVYTVAYKRNEGIQWIRMAAEQGFATAQFAMGFGCKSGLWGLPKDPVEGLAWLDLAAASGTGFGAERDKLATELGPARTATAQKRSQELLEQIQARRDKAVK
ncbi:MAG: hypothetical protein A3K19_33700 [Lentisphaerae bacterium RIFOXYB12_FULL_65_16]|nr:MAG: hypothetical protein A3K19_30305 [Lentisphaerae bacterium RIFOXYB12_FULL_65_16]OGV95389.1 MAG: hypothetical protein A3K19_33700 [Lentisphaerae bacterium RIFOXYB12_FULL_65_16]